MSTPIFRAAGLRPSSISIYIVNDRALNAFVAGGNNMFLHTGLLTGLDTPEEVIGVIAHEAGHIAGGHQTRRALLMRDAKGPALLGILAGIAAGVAGGGPDVAAAVLGGSQGVLQRAFLSYNRGEEAAADQAALRYLEQAGVDPRGMLSVLEQFRGQEVFSVGNMDPYVRSHPLSTQRMQLMEDAVAAAKDRTWPKDPEREYWFNRMQAKLEGYLDNPRQVLDRLSDRPEDEFTLNARAVALHRLPDPPAAMETIDRLIAMRPDDAFYLEMKAQILHESGRAAEAVPLYRRAVREAPGEPLLQAGLGRALLALNTDAADAEALRVLTAARDADPADTASLRDLATAYSRAGDIGMATLATAERFALSGRTEDALLHARRADALLPVGSPGWLRTQDILALEPKRN
jgi:predicted Zn-dependent protease